MTAPIFAHESISVHRLSAVTSLNKKGSRAGALELAKRVTLNLEVPTHAKLHNPRSALNRGDDAEVRRANVERVDIRVTVR